MRLKVLIGELEFYNDKKSLFDIAPFLENRDLFISQTTNNQLSTINNMVFAFFKDIDLMSEVDGLADFIDRNKDYSLFPILIYYDDELLFNGYIDRGTLTFERGTSFSNSVVSKYDINIIHKPYELNNLYINKILQYKNSKAKNYFTTLFDNSPRINKYKSKIKLPLDASNFIEIDKNSFYNFNLIKLGDVIHTDDRGIINSYIITEIEQTITTIKLYTDTLITSATDDRIIKIGYIIEAVDELSNPFISNPILQFKPALALIDDMSNQYLFNYKINNKGKITFFNSTSDISFDDNEPYMLQVGNSQENLALSGIITEITPPRVWQMTVDLLQEQIYRIDIETTPADITFYLGDDSPATTEIIDYVDGNAYTFYNPTGNDTLKIQINSDVVGQAPVFSINIIEYNLNEIEIDSIYNIKNIIIDGSGIRTALNISNYSRQSKEETLENITMTTPALNMFHKIIDTPVNSTETLTDGKEDSIFFKLGGDYDYVEFPIITESETFLNKININVFRNTLLSNQCIFATFKRNDSEIVLNEIIKSSMITGTSLTISPTFINKKVSDIITCKLEKTYYENVLIQSDSFTTISPENYTTGDIIRVEIEDGFEERQVLDKVGSVITLNSTLDGNRYVITNASNSSTDYLEFEATNIVADGINYIETNNTKDYAKNVVKETITQNALVFRYPINDEGEQLFLQANENTAKDTYKIVNENFVPQDNFVNDNSDYFKKLLTYNLVYFQIFNTIENKWDIYRVKSYINDTVTFYESINLYGQSTSNLVQFRRVYITNTVAFQSKETQDLIYEAMITTGRSSFGFNYKIDSEAIDYFINGDTSKTKGKMYGKGNVIGCEYLIEQDYPRYLENFDATDKYGIIEDIFSEKLDNQDTFITVSNNLLRCNSKSLLQMDLAVNTVYFKKLISTKNIDDILLIKMYHDRLPLTPTIFSVDEKSYNIAKSGINTLTLKLTEVV